MIGGLEPGNLKVGAKVHASFALIVVEFFVRSVLLEKDAICDPHFPAQQCVLLATHALKHLLWCIRHPIRLQVILICHLHFLMQRHLL